MQVLLIDYVLPTDKASGYLYAACEAIRLVEKKLGEAAAAFDSEPSKSRRESYRRRVNKAHGFDEAFGEDYDGLGLEQYELEDAQRSMRLFALILQAPIPFDGKAAMQSCSRPSRTPSATLFELFGARGR